MRVSFVINDNSLHIGRDEIDFIIELVHYYCIPRSPYSHGRILQSHTGMRCLFALALEQGSDIPKLH